MLGCGGFCQKGTPYYDPNTKDFGPRVGWRGRLPRSRENHDSAQASASTTAATRTTISAIRRRAPCRAIRSHRRIFRLWRIRWSRSSIPRISYSAPRRSIATARTCTTRTGISWSQQQLPQDWLVQVGYTGSEGHHLFDRYTVNLINPLTGTRPLAGFGSFGFKANDGNNNFNALQVSLHRRFVRGLLFQMNYMWSHGITDASIGSGESVAIQDMACRACDRSSTNIDVRHNMTANAIYELPFGHGKQFLNGDTASKFLGGWELAGISTARTGLPVNITMSRKATRLLDGNTSSQRPNLVPGVPIYAANQTIDNWFNPAAFALPANGTWGNLGRYIANGPGMYEIDSSLQKRFQITERLALNFRAAAYNLLNHPIFKTPSSSIGALTGNPPAVSGSFGRITEHHQHGAVGTGAPRRIEFMFRAEF